VLVTPRGRLEGLSRARHGAVLLLTRSIHTFTMPRPIGVVVLDLDGTVVSSGAMAPRRVAFFGPRRWVIEVGSDGSLPSPGTRVIASTMPTPCPEH
jgi:hypothetical protein